MGLYPLKLSWELRSIPPPTTLYFPSPGRHVAWQAAMAWLVAAITLAGTRVKHLEGWPVASGTSGSRSCWRSPTTVTVSRGSCSPFASTLSRSAILTGRAPSSTGALVSASAGFDGQGRGLGRFGLKSWGWAWDLVCS